MWNFTEFRKIMDRSAEPGKIRNKGKRKPGFRTVKHCKSPFQPVSSSPLESAPVYLDHVHTNPQNFTELYNFSGRQKGNALPLRVNLPDFSFVSADLHQSSDIQVPHTAAENGKKLPVSRRQVGLWGTREKIPVVS